MQAQIGALSCKQLAKLAKEVTKLAEWTTVRDFATQMYEEGKVARVSIDTYGEYDDEGGTDYRIEDITAYDASGNVLEFDLSLPFFSSKHWTDEEYRDAGDFDDPMRQFLDIYLWRSEDKQNNVFVFKADLPVEDATYDLTAVPVISVFQD